MTHASKSPVKRIVTTARGDRVVTVTNAGLMVRRTKSRTTYGPISWTAIEDLGAKMHADTERTRARRTTRNALKVGL